MYIVQCKGYPQRTRATYNSDCDLLELCREDHQRQAIAKNVGIVKRSGLNKLHYFHVNDGLPPDIMHDLLEGAVPCEVKCLLKTCILEKKLFSLQFFNNRMTYYE